MTPLLAITLGDPGGIGPEVTFGAVAACGEDGYQPFLVGSLAVARAHAERLGLGVQIEAVTGPEEADAVLGRGALPLLDVSEGADLDLPWGRATAAGGALSMRAVERATRLCLAGEVGAMVTAPISKEAISLAGHDVPGHTEFIARLCGVTDEVMLLVSGDLRVALVTVHVPLRRVADLVTADAILARRRTLERSLRADFGIAAPRVAVLGLNPHAGDGGVLGMEETDVIAPAIAACVAEGFATDGPFPADGFFAAVATGLPGVARYDAVLAMYHDQGLAPFKALAYETGVNATVGLPIVRTSPDHGTAYGIAGQGRADAASMRAACRLAATLARRRARATRPSGRG